ncbi:MAG TPA: FeoA family protein [Candidatus Limnocylindria bacterium]|jgi:ferrous iron transport protein A|nr:FeoA family protein [Candidatus Limnocylindria bacterium]
MTDPQSLASLAPGSKAVIAEIRVPVEHRGRLLEMGMLVGTAVELVRFAPLGDPVEIKVRGYHLSLRRHEAELILVRPAK